MCRNDKQAPSIIPNSIHNLMVELARMDEDESEADESESEADEDTRPHLSAH